MDKQQMADKAAETLRPFETANLIETMQHLSIQQIFSHPVVLIVVSLLFFFGVIKRSKPVLLTLFSMICMVVIMSYSMPGPGDEFSLQTMLPFVGGGLLIGGVIIYFSFIKSE